MENGFNANPQKDGIDKKSYGYSSGEELVRTKE
jgi:hypothetical protein